MALTSKLRLKCRPREWTIKPETGKRYSTDLNLHVFDEHGDICPRFELMCTAIDNDVLAGGDGWFDWIAQIESGEKDLIEADGSAWVVHITRDKVWFASLYNQGEGGEISLTQYKLAMQAYAQFLADPNSTSVEVDFPT